MTTNDATAQEPRPGTTPGGESALLSSYREHGLKLVRLHGKTKKPVDMKWQLGDGLTLEEALQALRAGYQIGLQAGEVSGWIGCVDLDSVEAVWLAQHFLAPTLRQGKGAEVSHYVYRAVGLGYEAFDDLDGGRIIDIKASSNGRGHQFVVEPSTHSTKGPYEWVGGFAPEKIAEVSASELRRDVGLLAAATLIARHLPDRGRHRYSLALAGFLLRNGVERSTVKKLLTAAWWCRSAPTEGRDAAGRNVDDTAEKLERGEHVIGGGVLEELVPGMPGKLAKFLQLPEASEAGTMLGGLKRLPAANEKRKQADRVIDYALKSGAKLFCDQVGAPHVLIDGEALPLNSRSYKWLRSLMWDQEGISVSGEALKTAAGTLGAFAANEGRVMELHTRAAWHEDGLYYQLRHGHVVKVDRDGWGVAENPPVVFRSIPNLKPLPDPEKGGTLEALEELINLKGERDKRMLRAYLITLPLPHIPRPILQTTGVMGSGKTTAGRLIKRLLDPTAPETVRADPRDFLQKASHSFIVMLDNQNSLPEWAVDMLCRLVTGEADSKRSLYTDDEDFIYEMRRAVLLNGINAPTERGDAQDRTLPIELERIADGERREEEELWARFEEEHARLLGAVFEALSQAIRARESLTMSRRPRLADWGRYAASVYKVFGWGVETFMEDWGEVVKVQNQGTLDGSSVAQAILSFMESRNEWTGLASDLHAKLEVEAEELNINVKKDKTWPKSPLWLSRRIREVVPLLRAMGVEVEISSNGKTGTEITLKRVPTDGPDDGGGGSRRDGGSKESSTTTATTTTNPAREWESENGGSRGSKSGYSHPPLSRTEEENGVNKGENDSKTHTPLTTPTDTTPTTTTATTTEKPLTDEEVQHIRELVRQGMSTKLARKTVLAERERRACGGIRRRDA